MGKYRDYLAEQMAGIQEGIGQIADAGMADIGDSYQEILTGNSAISAPDGLQQAEVAAPETQQPEIDIEP